MGTNEDVQKLFDALCEPNKYGGTGIRLDRESIHPVKGTAFPLWEAKGGTNNMPKRANKDDFKDLYTDFPALSVYLIVYSENGHAVDYCGVNGHCDMLARCKQKESIDGLKVWKMLYNLWKSLKYVPETVTKTEAMCLEAVKQYGEDLQYVPNELKMTELCLAAVKRNGKALEFVPDDELKTAELCHEAVKENGSALQYVPDELKTVDLCLAAVKSFSQDLALAYVPEKLKTTELCLAAVKQTSAALEYVPDELKTVDLCLTAVKNTFASFIMGGVLKFFPEKLKTAELCLEVVKKWGDALQYVPEELKTAEICFKAVKRAGKALQYVPGELKTMEICLEAVNQNGSALEFVPDEFKTTELCLQAVKQNRGMLQYVPEELKTAEMRHEASKQDEKVGTCFDLTNVPESEVPKAMAACIDKVLLETHVYEASL
jgi:hypothetical protein